MASLELLLENPDWRAYSEYAQNYPPNGGYYRRWIQGSVGMMSGMPLYSNEYSHLYMKHGQNDTCPYRGNLKHFSPSVTQNLRGQVSDCSFATTDSVGCQVAAIRKAFTHDSSREGYGRPSQTPHPFGVSYVTGYRPNTMQIPPDDPCQD